MRSQLFTRGQVEWALWKFSTIDLPAGEESVSTFRARVKHLLQLDRSGAIQGHPADPPPVAHALSLEGPGGTGVDAAFTAFDAFCLAVAIDFLRSGFKQAEVLLLMLHLRPWLQRPFTKILCAPPPYRSRRTVKTFSDAVKELSAEDRRVFLVIHRVEFSEKSPAFGRPTFRQSAATVFRDPMFCNGVNELRNYLDKMDHTFRRAIVLEIAHMAARIAELLNQAPLKRRGRPHKRV